MLTVFEKIPDIFIEIYDHQFQTWAREFKRRGLKCAIVFVQRPGQPVVLDEGGRPVAAGAWFEAEIDRSLPQQPKVIIRPATAHDEEMVARHCREMRGSVLQ